MTNTPVADLVAVSECIEMVDELYDSVLARKARQELAALNPASAEPVACQQEDLVTEVPVDLSHGWLIHKAGRGWYRPNAQGYTSSTAEAGRYSHDDALSYSHPNGWDGPRDGITIKHESKITPQPTPMTVEAALLQRAVDLIRGDISIGEWNEARNDFVKDALRALSGEKS